MGIVDQEIELLESFEKISLDELLNGFLLNRREIKFFFHESILPDLYALLREDYLVLDIDGKRTQRYETMYLDTKELKHYMNHHNERKNRYKVRFRDYIQSQISFFEIKHKRNNGQTEKIRISIPFKDRSISREVQEFLSSNYPYKLNELVPSICSSYERTTLVSKARDARLTIDKNLSFSIDENHEEMGSFVILEMKYGSDFDWHKWRRAFKDIGLFSKRVSKYCLAICYLFPEVKQNNFKNKLRRIKAIRTLN